MSEIEITDLRYQKPPPPPLPLISVWSDGRCVYCGTKVESTGGCSCRWQSTNFVEESNG